MEFTVSYIISPHLSPCFSPFIFLPCSVSFPLFSHSLSHSLSLSLSLIYTCVLVCLCVCEMCFTTGLSGHLGPWYSSLSNIGIEPRTLCFLVQSPTDINCIWFPFDILFVYRVHFMVRGYGRGLGLWSGALVESWGSWDLLNCFTKSRCEVLWSFLYFQQILS